MRFFKEIIYVRYTEKMSGTTDPRAPVEMLGNMGDARVLGSTSSLDLEDVAGNVNATDLRAFHSSTFNQGGNLHTTTNAACTIFNI